MSQELSEIEAEAKKLLSKIGFPDAKTTVEASDEDLIAIEIDVPSQDSGMLIGFHGETLSAFQLILGQILYKKFGSWRRISVNIGDYRQKRQETLESMATNAAQRAKLTKAPVTMPYLLSNERRIIHLTLSQDPDVETISEGIGKDRRLVVRPRVKDEKRKKE